LNVNEILITVEGGYILTTSKQTKSAWLLMISAAAILMITMGARQSVGLFINPLDSATGLGIVSISFALAIGQFMWGLAQPIFGAIADKKGSYHVLVFGTLLLAAGLALTPLVQSEWSLILTMGILSAAGAGAGRFSVLIGATSGQLPVEKRAFAGGFINAGGSLGQFIFAPLLQAIISIFGWVAAILTMAATTLLSIPLASVLCRGSSAAASKAAITEAPSMGLYQQVCQAMRNPSYLCLHAGFFTCGFHVAFLVTHLPGEVSLCGHAASVSAASLALIGLFNIAGSLLAGALGTRYRMKYILAVMYASRAVMIVLYLLAPKTPLTFYIFAAGLGFTWLATVPPTAGLVGKLFGTRYLATLFGLTLLTHQIGGFLGAWLGGLAMAHDGNYQWMWYADMLLAVFAAIVNLPIKEAKMADKPATV
jgi:MFS family permease